MPLFQITAERKLEAVPETTFGAESIMARGDLQKSLKDRIEVLGEELLVVSEEYGEWIESSRRIDLLCLDKEANLVVVELKRTDDGGHMELQALRYAAMVSDMTFEQLIARDKTDSHVGRRALPQDWLSGSIGRSGFSLNYTVRRTDSRIALWIDLGAGKTQRNKTAFRLLEQQRTAIEADFGGALEWQEMPDRQASQIRFEIEGGYQSPSEDWLEIQEKLATAMARLQKAMQQRVLNLQF